MFVYTTVALALLVVLYILSNHQIYCLFVCSHNVLRILQYIDRQVSTITPLYTVYTSI